MNVDGRMHKKYRENVIGDKSCHPDKTETGIHILKFRHQRCREHIQNHKQLARYDKQEHKELSDEKYAKLYVHVDEEMSSNSPSGKR